MLSYSRSARRNNSPRHLAPTSLKRDIFFTSRNVFIALWRVSKTVWHTFHWAVSSPFSVVNLDSNFRKPFPFVGNQNDRAKRVRIRRHLVNTPAPARTVAQRLDVGWSAAL